MLKTIPTIFTVLLIFSCLLGNAQQFTLKGQDYPATHVWYFLVKRHIYDSTLSVQIGRTDKGGLMQLTIDSSHPHHYIGSTMYLFLEDNSIITCTDKQMRESSGNSITSWYVLTPKEIQMLKSKRITDIRFVILGQTTLFASRTGYFTAINRKHFFDVYHDADNRSDTAADISALFN